MPFVIRYPGKIKPKTINEDIITNIDFAPTLLEIANIKAPSSVQEKKLRNERLKIVSISAASLILLLFIISGFIMF